MVRLEYAIVLAIGRLYQRVGGRRSGAPLQDVKIAAHGDGLPFDRGRAVAYHAAVVWWLVGVVSFVVGVVLGVIIRLLVVQPAMPIRDAVPFFALLAASVVAFCEFAVVSLRVRWTEFFDRRADRRVRSRKLSSPLDFWAGVAFAALVSAGPLYAAFSS